MKSQSPDRIVELGDQEVREVLKRNYIGSLAYLAQGVPHVLPITYFYDEDRASLISYSSIGHKILAMREHPAVALTVYEMDTAAQWKSVMVHGEYQELQQIDAKVYLKRFSEGIREILGAGEGGEPAVIGEFSSKAADGRIPLVYCIRIEDWTGKCRES